MVLWEAEGEQVREIGSGGGRGMSSSTLPGSVLGLERRVPSCLEHQEAFRTQGCPTGIEGRKEEIPMGSPGQQTEGRTLQS